ncbi:MAG: DEAD/DEAH box helicase [Ruminococcaceae bacterium]|nr:DEAD/DEAH box helicase [Oscillospiraceae bacterium]
MEKTFEALGVSEYILKALAEQGVTLPTKVQLEGIGPLLAWKDVIAKAPTGTGKTFAFGIPMIEHIEPESEELQGLILAPTRELALQICDELRGLLTHRKDVRVAVVYGGQRMEPQLKALKAKPQILVATPGRLMDHYNRKNIRFDKIKTVILDEADRMLDMGFFDDVTAILNRIKNRVNLGLFSATISQEVQTVSWMYQRDEVEITVEATNESKPDIDQFSITCTRLDKLNVTLQLLRSGAFERVIIFCNTKAMCQRLTEDLKRDGIHADCLHGDIRQATRERTMAAFRHGKLPVLIATDVASRGIDVDDVDGVINYDVPEENEYYIHRIGRTGRARKKGMAFTLIATFPEKAKLDEIAKFAEFSITSMMFDKYGCLIPEESEEKPQQRRKF